MKTLDEFLKEKASESRDSQIQIEAKQREWADSVRRLIERAKSWLEESDRDTKILSLVVDENCTINEEELGVYSAPCLRIRLGKRIVEVRPVARNVVGGIDEGGIHVRADGRVDISDRSRRYILYRIKNASGDQWKIVDTDRYTVKDLDALEFKAAVQSLLE